MNALHKTLNKLIEQNQAEEACEHHCPHCGRLVPKKEIDLLGKKRLVQPKCECEVQAMENELKRLVKAGEKRHVERKFALNSLGTRFSESTFEDFSVRKGSEKAFEITQKYVRDFEEWGSDSLIMWGIPGNGKSHLAGAVFNQLTKKEYIVIYQNVPELLQKIRDTFNKRNEDSEQDIIKMLHNCDLLILDDIGAEKVSEWVHDVLFRIIDGRYRKKKPIMYTSNLSLDQLEAKIGERILDRIDETCLAVQNNATSYRKEISNERLEKLKR